MKRSWEDKITCSKIGIDCKVEDNSWPVYSAINPDLFYFPLDPNPKLQKCWEPKFNKSNKSRFVLFSSWSQSKAAKVLRIKNLINPINPDLFYFPRDPNPKLQKCWEPKINVAKYVRRQIPDILVVKLRSQKKGVS